MQLSVREKVLNHENVRKKTVLISFENNFLLKNTTKQKEANSNDKAMFPVKNKHKLRMLTTWK